MSILRELFVKLGLDVDAQSFAKGTLAADLVKASLVKVVDTAKELAGQFVENIQATAEYGEQITQLGAATGLGTKSLQQLRLAAIDDGVSVEDLSRSMVLLSRTMFAAKEAGGEQAKAFQQLGVKVTDAHGKLRPTEDVFTDIADAISKMDDGAKKTALSMQIFGKSGSSMIEMLNRGGDDLRKYFQASVLSDEQLRAGKEVVAIQRQLKEQTADLWRSAIGPLMPAIRDLLKRFYDWKKANADLMKVNIQRFLEVGIFLVKGLEKGLELVIGTIKFFKDNAKSLTVIVLSVVIPAIVAWAASNLSLIGTYLALEAVGLAVQLSLAAAWLTAAGPFLILGGIIGGMILLFDDLRRYSEAAGDKTKQHHTLFGRFNEQLDAWGKEKGPRPWWLSVLKEARDDLQALIELAKIWNESSLPEFLLGARQHSENEALTPEARARVARMQQREMAAHPTEQEGWFSRHARSALDWAFGAPNRPPMYQVTLPGVSGPPVPTLPSAAIGGSRGDTNINLVQHNYPSPGMDEEKFADKVIQKAKGVFVAHSDVEHATAAAVHQ